LITENTHTESISFPEKVVAYALFIKLRLATLVVISAVLGYLLAAPSVSWFNLIILIVGGFLVTGSSNGFNQILERNFDKLMKRTESRPLVTGKMSLTEAIVLASLCGVVGVFLLWYFLNPLSGILGLLALFLYVAVYTPLKRVTPFAVFVGAFPGAIPPMLGWVAETGSFGIEPGVLFAMQFIWQFPHFWAIAWVMDEDYKKAGFRLLPSPGGKDKSTAFQMVVYSLFLIPAGMFPWIFGISGIYSAIIAFVAGVLFLLPAIKLFKSLDDKDARTLMFASFLYLPLVQLSYVLDKI
jgi:heme o synthase